MTTWQVCRDRLQCPDASENPSLRRSQKPIRARKKAQKRVGRVSGTVRLSGAAMEALRRSGMRSIVVAAHGRDAGSVLPLYGSVFNRAHLAHIKSHGAGGGDTLENTHIRCYHHHIEMEHTKGIKDAN